MLPFMNRFDFSDGLNFKDKDITNEAEEQERKDFEKKKNPEKINDAIKGAIDINNHVFSLKLAKNILSLLWFWVWFIIVILFFQMFGYTVLTVIFQIIGLTFPETFIPLSDNVLMTLMGTTTVNIISLVIIMEKFYFKR